MRFAIIDDGPVMRMGREAAPIQQVSVGEEASEEVDKSINKLSGDHGQGSEEINREMREREMGATCLGWSGGIPEEVIFE